MRTIQDVETIGIYTDEIRIISKNEEPSNFNRKNHRLTIQDIYRIEDEKTAPHQERHITVKLKEGVHCDISDTAIKCGFFFRWYS